MNVGEYFIESLYYYINLRTKPNDSDSLGFSICRQILFECRFMILGTSFLRTKWNLDIHEAVNLLNNDSLNN